MTGPTLLWFRRDLRLQDHPALNAALRSGGAVIPVFIRDALTEHLGAAPALRLNDALAQFSRNLEQVGSRLILRSGLAQDVLQKLIQETGAQAVFWTRCYDPAFRKRDSEIKKTLKKQGIKAQSYSGQLLFEPQDIRTGTGTHYRVYTPFWRNVRGRDVGALLPAPKALPAPQDWPRSERLSAWSLGRAMQRGAPILRAHFQAGEDAALTRLEHFSDARLASYAQDRDRPGLDGTSGMSEYLALGEISPHRCWHRGQLELEAGTQGAEKWLKELAWREFAYHLAYHDPHITTRSWKPDWDRFPWQTDPDHPHVLAWKQGRTGVPFVDAALREMYVTGRMHNRGRMIVAAYLTKHLMTHWKIGQDWFADCLIDWDPAANAMGWQWSAGSGPDAAPYFRIFNPDTQLAKFDPAQDYVRKWIAEGQKAPPPTALSYFQAIPRSWGMSPSDLYPQPIVSLAEGRKTALMAYENRGF
ncbi:cryptochrome/photolyase family protein [Thalassobius sp. S69A]|uniref:cryptochrome/photolyase family protein n=1 Tax=unclassified Thalassovita TaxID=2619711 RepID=UPI000C362359|nr:deoxyribodipyrimidine photolyase [Paracoccaceae bacterium]